MSDATVMDGAVSGEEDAGTNQDGSNGQRDASSDDDAGIVVTDPQFLLGFAINPDIGGTYTLRLIATVALEGDTIDVSFQPLYDPGCNDRMSGEPVGVSRAETGVLFSNGSFDLEMANWMLPAGSLSSLCGEIAVDISISGRGAMLEPCGDVTGTAIGMSLSGTFGGLSIPTGTTGDDALPPAVFACPE